MGKLITISRQFGSGGREIGKKLSEKLEINYYDREIIEEVASKTGLHKNYVEANENNITKNFPIAFGRAFTSYAQPVSDKLFLAQSDAIKDLAKKGKGVFVGRCADYILKDKKILKVFIYSSDIDKKINGCYERVPADRRYNRKAMRRKIEEVDEKRRRYYNYYTGKKYGNPTNYNIAIDTAKFSVNQAVDIIISALKNIK